MVKKYIDLKDFKLCAHKYACINLFIGTYITLNRIKFKIPIEIYINLLHYQKE
jgi:hypothetical protein